MYNVKSYSMVGQMCAVQARNATHKQNGVVAAIRLNLLLFQHGWHTLCWKFNG